MRTYITAALVAGAFVSIVSGTAQQTTDLDTRVQAFLDQRRGTWREGNISERDGRLLFDMIVQNRHTRALEIGTSTGHSSIWIARALAKTGGTLTTIEIDEGRHRTAVANFKEAGLAKFIDARLANAHELVRQLPGPFDFVFSDADISQDYFDAATAKLVVGGRYVSHGVRNGRPAAYIDYLRSLTNFETVFDMGDGFCTSVKKSAK